MNAFKSPRPTSSVSVAVQGGSSVRHVSVTPLQFPSHQATINVPPLALSIEKILLKAVCKSKSGTKNKDKVDPKTFTLRNINTAKVCSCKDLKGVIRAQLSDDIVTGEFEVGVLQGNTVVNLRSKDDVLDVWKEVKKGIKITLWCDGLRIINPKRNEGYRVMMMMKAKNVMPE